MYFHKKTPIWFCFINKTLYICIRFRAISSVGSEHLPYKQGVTGSNPVSPTVEDQGVSIKLAPFFMSWFKHSVNRITSYSCGETARLFSFATLRPQNIPNPSQNQLILFNNSDSIIQTFCIPILYPGH